MMPADQVEGQHWDCLVVGTGMGGATLGYALAKAGRRVLFVEKGRAAFSQDTLRGAYPELDFPKQEAPSPRHAATLARAGRYYEEIRDGQRAFVPLMGFGTGGSSALYGMAMERFFPADFEPGRQFPDHNDSSMPAAWPIGYRDMELWYELAEALYRVRGGRDPLRPGGPPLLPAPPLSPCHAELHAHFQTRGLHPYRLPMACEYVPDCECCQGYLCARGCKNDAGRICLEPAVREHGATLLDECEVLRLEADAERVTGVVCSHHGQTLNLHAEQVVLAAGALATPALLLRSTSRHWPQGLANRSGLVGRNLMRHGIDLYLVFTRENEDRRRKEIGLSDLYDGAGGKLGTLQSFGVLPPASILTATLAKEVAEAAPWAAPLFGLARPLLRPALSRIFGRGVLLAAIMEDLPYMENRVVPGPPLGIDYRLHPYDRRRLGAFRRGIADILRPYRFLALRQAEKNAMLAHACGTCRFGEDPATSVLDADNRAHDVRNLYVVDGSFFPSSGGTNPALTIAANALRVAARILE